MTISAGTRLGPYEILSAIGAGGMGEVYKASDTRLHRTVAIKVLPQHVSGDAEVKRRFEREAQAVAALNHPHICVLHDVGRHDDTDYIVLEYLEGETLATRLEKGPIPLDQALRYALQVSDALDKAHARGVVHRDLKPGNIMLTKTGVKLLDFGLALYFIGDRLDLSMLSLVDRKSTDLGVKGGGADGSLSPDGRWLAYYSRETGRLEVTTFPASSTRITVAPSGGDTHWSRKGNALFYLNMRTGELMGVDVMPGDPPRFGSPRRIYAGPMDFFTIHSFDLTPNEDRFIVHTPDPGGDITVLLNWQSLLKQGR